jgi:hypothetical protein
VSPRLRAAAAAALLALACAPSAHAAGDPGRFTETGRSTVPVSYYQGIASDLQGRRLFFDGVFAGLYRTDSSLDERAAHDDVFPARVSESEHYNHVGDIAFDKREGGRVLLPVECYYPGTSGPGEDPANTCRTGSIGVADPRTLAWRYYVKLDPAEIRKAMWIAVSPDRRLAWTQSGSDLLAYSLDDVSPAHAAPSNAPIRAVRRVADAVPPHGITGAAFVGERLFAAANQGAQGRIRVWSIDVRTGDRRLEIAKRVDAGESEGLDVFSGLGGTLHCLIQRSVHGLPPYFYGNGLLIHFVRRGEEPSGERVHPARMRLSVSPASVPHGQTATLVFTATAQIAGRLVPVDRATVALDGQSATTDGQGRAAIEFSSSRVGEHEASATRQNLRRGTATVRVTGP